MTIDNCEKCKAHPRFTRDTALCLWCLLDRENAQPTPVVQVTA